MKNSTIRRLTIIAALCIVGIVAVQGFWLKRAFDLRERQFHQNVQLVLQQVAESMRAYAQLPPFGQNPVVQLSSNYYAVMINDKVDPQLLEGLLTRELLRRNLQLDYEYGIYNCDHETLVYGNYVSLQDQQPAPSTDLPEWPRDNYYFSVYFPTKAGYLAESMDIWLFSTCVMLLVIAFFTYTTFVVLKQKRYSEIQKDFINTITHEVKTPVTTIMLSAQALQRQQVLEQPEHARTYTQLILQEATRIKSQVEQVLHTANVEKEKLFLNKEGLDLHRLISEVADSMAVLLKEQGATIELELHARHSFIQGDRLHLTNVLFNLIDNACKYSDTSPHIRISTESTQNKLILLVADKGRGIPRQEQKKVFERFYRGRPSVGRPSVGRPSIERPLGEQLPAAAPSVKGFGLGLYYVRQVVLAHRGKILLESLPGKGSIFSVQFPKPLSIS